MSGHEAGIGQLGRHSALARPGEPGGSSRADVLGLDAIIVPGTRKAEHLDHAVTLARATRCSLVVLCSHELHGSEVDEYLAARMFTNAIVIDLPTGYSHPLFEFRGLQDIKGQLPEECHDYASDLSMKRNIGLVLARMLGWQRIFFLDDDIEDIAYPDLQRTVDMLGSFPVVGMCVTKFPDNSIVCHANRETGGSQDVFVSGAALAVDCSDYIGFFPDIYNEDWLFFFDAAFEGKLVNSCLEARQLAYYPFANAKRAASQEFGDVLAEGLYALLRMGNGVGVAQATITYWSFFLKTRQDFIKATLSRVPKAQLKMRGDIIVSLQSALKCLKGISPATCARYVEVWRQDLNDWKERVAAIRVMPSVEAALAELELAPTPAGSMKRLLHPLDRAAEAPGHKTVAIAGLDTLREMADHQSTHHLTPRRPDGQTMTTRIFPWGGRSA